MYKGHGRKLYVSFFSKEAAYDTAETVDCELRVNSQPGEPIVETDNDRDEIGSNEEGNNTWEVANRIEIPIEQSKLRPNTLAGIATYALGSISSAQEGAYDSYVHTITPLSTYELPSFTVEDKLHGSLQRKYSGVFINDFTLSCQRKGFWSIAANCIGSGTAAAGSESPSAISENPLMAGIAKVWSGTGYDGSVSQNKTTADLSGSSDLTSRIVSANWGYNNNCNVDDGYYWNGDGVLERAVRGKRSQTLSMTLELDAGAAELASMTSLSNKGIEFEVYGSSKVDGDGANYFGFNLIFPLVNIVKWKPMGLSGDIMTVDVECDVLQHATHGSVLLTVYNAQAAYAG